MPGLFLSWGRDASLSDAKIRTEWVSIVDAAGGDDPMTAVWGRSLKGELFDDEEHST